METTQPKLVIPQLRSFYAWAEPISWALIRLTAGLMILPHGWPKLMAGPAAIAANVMARRGIEPAYVVACIAIFLEIVGAVCIILGLLTRPFAALLVIEFLIIVKSHLNAG
jgi:putative oxidoreductase